MVEQELAVGSQIPSLRALAAEYEVAELTVHAAVKQLQHEGVLASASGRGTFVKALPIASPDEADNIATVMAELRGLRQELEVLRSRVDALEGTEPTG